MERSALSTVTLSMSRYFALMNQGAPDQSETEASHAAAVDVESTERRAALAAATAAAQGYGIVLTIPLVEQVLKWIKGEPMDADPDTVERAVQFYYDQATDRT